MTRPMCRCGGGKHQPHPPYKCKETDWASSSRSRKCRCTISAERAVDIAQHEAAGHWFNYLTGAWEPR